MISMPYRFYGNAMSFKRKKKNAVYELEIFLFSSRSAFVRVRICYAAVTSNLKLQWLRKTKAYFFLRHVMRPSQVDGGLQSAHSFWDMGRWHSHSREYRQSPWQIGGRNSIRRPLAIR